MEGRASISTEILGRYAADAAKDVPGVRRLVESHLHRHRGVKVTADEGAVSVELHLAVDWAPNLPAVGRAVQSRVVDYLGRMADVTPAAVDVVIAEIGDPG